jgi:hypothetical protein
MSPRARHVLEYLKNTGRAFWIDETIRMPNGDALREIANATGLSVADVVGALGELNWRGLLKEQPVEVPGMRTFRMLSAPHAGMGFVPGGSLGDPR